MNVRLGAPYSSLLKIKYLLYYYEYWRRKKILGSELRYNFKQRTFAEAWYFYSIGSETRSLSWTKERPELPQCRQQEMWFEESYSEELEMISWKVICAYDFR